MKKDYCEIVLVLDRSWSMESIKKDVIGGFNKFLTEQKAVPGEATITLAQFDHLYEIVYEGKKLQDAPLMDDTIYQPRGWTALLDAIGRTIDITGKRLSDMPEDQRPEKVLFVIQTDGYENASHKFSNDNIMNMLIHQKDVYKWEFVFLGANQDAIATASKMGIGASHSMTYVASAGGVNASYNSLSSNIANFRTGTSDTVAFTETDRKNQPIVKELEMYQWMNEGV